ncbi:hypothetical protein [Gimesia alba]|uniref:hypothetical protein n=1 Tax=Gimesia alba TaxID=2527973 RepID=UPI0011A00165|nr:hypothetical protein [Gimesia alba]
MRLMTNHCNRLFALLLMLTVSHLPLHWEHTHQGLSGQQLVRHLQLYHPATPASQIPQGWHCHSDWPFALTEDGTTAIPIQADSRILSDIGSLDLSSGRNCVSSPGKQWDRTVSLLETKCRQQTYLFLNVILI